MRTHQAERRATGVSVPGDAAGELEGALAGEPAAALFGEEAGESA